MSAVQKTVSALAFLTVVLAAGSAWPRPGITEKMHPGTDFRQTKTETPPATPATQPTPTADTPKAYEFVAIFGIGGPPFLAIPTRMGVNTQVMTFYGALRFRLPKYTPLALEASTVFAGAFGLGFNILCDVYRSDRLRIHVGDPGIFWNAYNHVTANSWSRPFDLTFGLGTEIRPALSGPWNMLRVTVDFRWFMPNPFTAQNQLGSFAIPIYEEAGKGVQLWIGVARTF